MGIENVLFDPAFGGFKLVVKAMANGPKDGDWIRFDASGGLKDLVGNGAHTNNRWVRLVNRY